MFWWHVGRWLTSPVWQVRERWRYDARRWRFARQAVAAWDTVEAERKKIHDNWILTERVDPKNEAVPSLKAKDEALTWVLNLAELERRD